MRKQIQISLQDAEQQMLDHLAEKLGLTRSGCIKYLVARYYSDHKLKRFWEEHETAQKAPKVARYGRKVE